MARENHLGFRKSGSGQSLGVITPSTREAQEQAQRPVDQEHQRQAELERQRRIQDQRRDD